MWVGLLWQMLGHGNAAPAWSRKRKKIIEQHINHRLLRHYYGFCQRGKGWLNARLIRVALTINDSTASLLTQGLGGNIDGDWTEVG